MVSKKDKSDIVSGLGVAFQIFKRLRDGGASDAELRRLLKEEELVDKVVEIIKFPAAGDSKEVKREPLFPSFNLAAELIPEGWVVVEDLQPADFQVANLEFPSFLEEDETSVGGKIMRSRAVMLRGNLGLVDGKRLLAEQNKIPVTLRGKCIIVLPGTLLRGLDGGLRVAFLYWFGDRWYLGFYWLDDDWSGYDRLARSK